MARKTAIQKNIRIMVLEFFFKYYIELDLNKLSLFSDSQYEKAKTTTDFIVKFYD